MIGPAYAQSNDVPPPARVGQVAYLSGSVSYNGAGSNDQWVAATQNYPVATGDSLFTQPDAQAALVLNASRIALAPNTELQVTSIDADNFAATESQGEIFLNLTDLEPGQSFVIDTPRGTVSFNANGEYDVITGDANNPTIVNVIRGSASIGQLQIPAGQAGYITGTDQSTVQLGALEPDAFMNTQVRRLAPPPPPYVPVVVQQMTGVSELSSYGTWNQNSAYGAVWYPSVAPGWAPYRVGHWAFIAPWGWTWVEAEPWGFAPFHYGRWIHEHERWGWVPAGAYEQGGYGPDYQPVYAPAVVGFFGLVAGVAITAEILNRGDVGWVPLGPGEAYSPYYHSDEHYDREINRVDVRNYNETQINERNVTINNYENRSGATYMPAHDLARGAPVRDFGHPVSGQMFSQAKPIQGGFNGAVRPDITHREAPAPQHSDFAVRPNARPPVVSHEPFHPAPSQHIGGLAGQPQFGNQKELRPGQPGQLDHGQPQSQPGKPEPAISHQSFTPAPSPHNGGFGGQPDHAQPPQFQQPQRAVEQPRPPEPQHIQPPQFQQPQRAVEQPRPPEPQHIQPPQFQQPQRAVEQPRPSEPQHIQPSQFQQPQRAVEQPRPPEPQHIQPPQFQRPQRAVEQPRPPEPQHIQPPQFQQPQHMQEQRQPEPPHVQAPRPEVAHPEAPHPAPPPVNPDDRHPPQ